MNLACRLILASATPSFEKQTNCYIIMMRCLSVGILLAAVLCAPAARAQTSGNPQCPGGAGSQLNNVEALRALLRNEVAAQVETEVARRLEATPGKIITQFIGLNPW